MLYSSHSTLRRKLKLYGMDGCKQYVTLSSLYLLILQVIKFNVILKANDIKFLRNFRVLDALNLVNLRIVVTSNIVFLSSEIELD